MGKKRRRCEDVETAVEVATAKDASRQQPAVDGHRVSRSTNNVLKDAGPPPIRTFVPLPYIQVPRKRKHDEATDRSGSPIDRPRTPPRLVSERASYCKNEGIQRPPTSLRSTAPAYGANTRERKRERKGDRKRERKREMKRERKRERRRKRKSLESLKGAPPVRTEAVRFKGVTSVPIGPAIKNAPPPDQEALEILPSNSSVGKSAVLSSSSPRVPFHYKVDDESSISGMSISSSGSKRLKCHVCKQAPLAEADQQLVHCTMCPRRYHRRCHSLPKVPNDIGDSWQCRRCVRKRTLPSSSLSEIAGEMAARGAKVQESEVSASERPAKRPRMEQTGTLDDVVQPAPTTARAQEMDSAANDAVRSTPATAKAQEMDSAADNAVRSTPAAAGAGETAHDSRSGTLDEADQLVESSFATPAALESATLPPAKEGEGLKRVRKRLAREEVAEQQSLRHAAVTAPMQDAHEKLSHQPQAHVSNIVEPPVITCKEPDVSVTGGVSEPCDPHPRPRRPQPTDAMHHGTKAPDRLDSASPMDSVLQAERAKLANNASPLGDKPAASSATAKKKVGKCSVCNVYQYCTRNVDGALWCPFCQRSKPEAIDASVAATQSAVDAAELQSKLRSIDAPSDKASRKKDLIASSDLLETAADTAELQSKLRSTDAPSDKASGKRAVIASTDLPETAETQKVVKRVQDAAHTGMQARRESADSPQLREHVVAVTKGVWKMVDETAVRQASTAKRMPKSANIKDERAWGTSRTGQASKVGSNVGLSASKNTDKRPAAASPGTLEAQPQSQEEYPRNDAQAIDQSSADPNFCANGEKPETASTAALTNGSGGELLLQSERTVPIILGGSVASATGERRRRRRSSAAALYTYETLVKFALCAAPRHCLQVKGICHWIAENVPGYTLGDPNSSWENGIGIVCSRNNGENKNFLRKVEIQAGEDVTYSRGGWYVLRPEVAEKCDRWDTALKQAARACGMVDVAAKIEEIKKRPTRKQMFGKPAMHSRLGSNVSTEQSSATSTPDDNALSSIDQPEGVESYTDAFPLVEGLQNFDTLEEFL